jgi:NitT/TauT family transport system substrate-binding protein
MVLATKKSGIGSVKDLKGKTVGVPKGTSGEMVLNLALEKAGIKPEEVNIVNMDVAGTVAAFVANKVDAVAIWSPYTFEIEKQIGKENVIKLADNTDFFPEYVFPQSWVVNPTFLEKNKDLVVKFVRAWAKANDDRLNNMDEAVKMTSAFTQVPEDSLKIQVETTKWLTSEEIKKYFQDGTAKQWYENLEKLFVKNGKLKEIVNGDEFIRPEPLYEALK